MLPVQRGELQGGANLWSRHQTQHPEKTFPITAAWPPPRTSHNHLYIVRGERWITRGSPEELVSLNRPHPSQQPCLPPGSGPAASQQVGSRALGFCSLAHGHGVAGLLWEA